MSEVKHTPGPWEVRSAYKKPLSIWDGDNNLIVTVVHGGDLNERQANAKLIAAAPKMLYELECTERYLEFVNESIDWLTRHPSENVTGWIRNQREMLDARIRCNKEAIKSATE